MNTPSDKNASCTIATELRLLRLALLLCFGTTVLLIGWHIHSELCVFVGFLFLLPTLYLKAVHLLHFLHDAPLIAAIREAALTQKLNPHLTTPDPQPSENPTIPALRHAKSSNEDSLRNRPPFARNQVKEIMVKILKKIILLAALVLTAYDLSAAELYNLDFTPPENGTYQTVFGTPTVQSSVGSFQDALVFNAVSTYEQIKFPITTVSGVPGYKVECDILTHNLQAVSYAFTIFLDTPQVRPVTISGYQNAYYSTYYGIDLSDDVAFHLEIIADFQANRMTVNFDDYQSLIRPLDASLVSSVRFSLAPSIGGTGDAPGTYVALDNIRISTIPEPPFWSLLLTALVPASFWYHRKKLIPKLVAP